MLSLNFLDDEETYLIEFRTVSDNVVEIKGDAPEDESGFTLSRIGKHDNWDYTSYTTIYRVPQNNVVQYSNDGSIYIPPKKDVTIKAFWNDFDNEQGIRPASIKVNVYCNGIKKSTITLNGKNNFEKVLTDCIADDVYTISTSDVDGYTKTISDTTIIFDIIPINEE